MIVNSTQELEQPRAARTCPASGDAHGPLVTDSIRGEILCAACGLVLADRVEDAGPEQRSYTLEEYSQNTRTGLASTLSIHDRGLSTVIGSSDRDASGKSISSYMKYTFGRLRTWDSRSKATSSERNLRSAFALMESAKSRLEISASVIERAAYIYRKALGKKIIRGRTISGMMLASVYLACRESGVPRSMQEVASAGNISFKDISRHYRVLVRSLGLQVESFNALEFVSKIGASVGLSEKSRRDAVYMLNRAHEMSITDGKNPTSLAATAVFLASVQNGEAVTQKAIAGASGVSSVTIRNQARILRKRLGIDV